MMITRGQMPGKLNAHVAKDIIGNDWYEKSTKKIVNCVDDDQSLG